MVSLPPNDASMLQPAASICMSDRRQFAVHLLSGNMALVLVSLSNALKEKGQGGRGLRSMPVYPVQCSCRHRQPCNHPLPGRSTVESLLCPFPCTAAAKGPIVQQNYNVPCKGRRGKGTANAMPVVPELIGSLEQSEFNASTTFESRLAGAAPTSSCRMGCMAAAAMG